MKYTIIALPALLLMAALPPRTVGSSSEGQTSDPSKTTHMEAKDAGWVSLFDGKTTKGWHTYGKTSADPQWEVTNGALHLDKAKGGGGDLLTDKEYGNFDLRLEWKIATAGNSGVMFYVQEGRQYQYPWQTGIESQVLDNVAGDDAKYDRHRAGDLYELSAGKPEAVRPANEWNRLEIVSDHGRLVEKLNGTVVLETTLWDEHWKRLIAGSKFRDMPGFGMFRSGKIALQDHGADVWFRNIMIRELK